MFIANDYKKLVVLQEDGAIGDECDYNSFANIIVDYPAGNIHIKIKPRNDGNPNSERVSIPGGFSGCLIEGPVYYEQNGTAFIDNAGGNIYRYINSINGSNSADLFINSQANENQFIDCRGTHTQGSFIVVTGVRDNKIINCEVDNVSGGSNFAQILFDNATKGLIDGVVIGTSQSRGISLQNISQQITITNSRIGSQVDHAIHLDQASEVFISNCFIECTAGSFAGIFFDTSSNRTWIDNVKAECTDYCLDTSSSSSVSELMIDNCFFQSTNFAQNPINAQNINNSNIGKVKTPGFTLGAGSQYFESSKDHMNGLTFRTTDGSPLTVDIRYGECKDSDNVVNIVYDSTYPGGTIQLNYATVGPGGHDGAGFTTGTWYKVWMIYDSTGVNPVSCIASSIASSNPNISPYGYDRYRYIGSIQTHASNPEFKYIESQGSGTDKEFSLISDRLTDKLWSSITANTGTWGGANITAIISPMQYAMRLALSFPVGGAGSLEIRGNGNTWVTNGEYAVEPGGGMKVFEIDNYNNGLFDYRPSVSSGQVFIYGDGWRERL